MSEQLFDAIDQARRRGLSYDEVHHRLLRNGVDPPHAKRLLDQYAKTALPDSRLRGQVNLGAPEEK